MNDEEITKEVLEELSKKQLWNVIEDNVGSHIENFTVGDAIKEAIRLAVQKTQESAFLEKSDTPKERDLEYLARLMHNWYLEITSKLNKKSFNINAQKSYEKLTEEQKAIDRFIAVKVLDLMDISNQEEGKHELLSKIRERIKELEEALDYDERMKLETSITIRIEQIKVLKELLDKEEIKE